MPLFFGFEALAGDKYKCNLVMNCQSADVATNVNTVEYYPLQILLHL